jgi:branched-chain amino acid transport system permease protein
MKREANLVGFIKDPLVIIGIIFFLYPIIPVIGKYTALGTELLIWGVFALSFNLVLGYTGLPSFGHGAFYGIGTYAAALTSIHLLGGHGLLLPMIMAALAGGLFTLIYGYVIRKKRGIYFALLTVAFSQVMYVIAFRWDEVTGGETGITGLARADLLGFISMESSVSFYYLVFVVFIIAVIIIRKIANSSIGRILYSIQQDDRRARYLGYDSDKYVWLAFTISGVFAGLAGGMYCLLHNSAFSDTLHWVKSGDVVMATLLGGGFANFWGPFVGGIIFIVAREFLSAFWDNWMLAYGFAFVAIILFIPTGLMGIVQQMQERRHVRAQREAIGASQQGGSSQEPQKEEDQS